MKISELDLEHTAINFLKSEGYEELFEPQAEAIKAGLFDDKKNILVTIPTASGKTLIAMLATLSHLSKHKTKVIYLTPLRALTSEKFEEFKKLEQVNIGQKIKVAISTGQEKTKTSLDDADIIFLTNESMDSHMAFQSKWIDNVGLVISDEIHLIGDTDRGPTLEMVLTRFRPKFRSKKLSTLKNNTFQASPKIIGLSATVSNSIQLANWLSCELIESNFRRVPLSETVYCNHTLYDESGGESDYVNYVETEQGGIVDRHKKSWIGLGLETVEKNAQCLIFSQSRRNAVAWAKDAGIEIEKSLSEKELKILTKISESILPKEKDDQTKLIGDLAKVVKQGSAFHHAGLDQKSRSIIETEFKNGHIKLLTATPTLAAGVNLPARRVIIQSVKRFTNNGLSDISVLEYKQMCGRAGRPQFDTKGESVIISNYENYENDLDDYVNGEVEPLESKTLHNDGTLRINILGFIKNNSRIKNKKSSPVSFEKILNFFSKTFGSYQLEHDTLANEKFYADYNDLEGYLDLEDSDKKIIDKLFDDDKISENSILKQKINKQLEILKKCGVIYEKKSGFHIEEFGKIVFNLRIDPQIAFEMYDHAENSVEGRKHTSGILHMITTLSGTPNMKFDQKFFDELSNYNYSEKLYKEQDLTKNLSKSLFILLNYIDGLSYSKMSSRYGIEPGDVYYFATQIRSLLYDFKKIVEFWLKIATENDDKLLASKYSVLIDEIETLELQTRHGVKDTHLHLVKIHNIGRVKAGTLYQAGFKNKNALKKATLKKLTVIDKIGSKDADNIMKYVEEKL